MAYRLLLVGAVMLSTTHCVLPPPPPEETDLGAQLAIKSTLLQPTTAQVATLFRGNPAIEEVFDLGPALQTLPSSPNVYWYIDFDFEAPRLHEFGESTKLSGCTPALAGKLDKDTLVVEAMVTYGELIIDQNPEPGTDPRRAEFNEPVVSIVWSAQIDGASQDCQ